MYRVVVQLRRSDLLRAQFQIILRMRLWLLLFAACLAANGYHFVNSTPPPAIGLAILYAFLAALLITAGGVLLAYLIVAPLMLLKLRHKPGVLGEHVFEAHEEGLREVTNVSEVRVAPGNARRLMRSRSFIIVMVAARGAFIIPRRDFPDAAAYDQFWKALQPLGTAREKRKAA